MRARYLRNVSLPALLDPGGAPWRELPAETLTLSPTPSALQPTAAVRAAFPDGRIGAITLAAVSALHNGRDIAFHLRWQDPSEDTGANGQDDTGFPDAAAILLPTLEDAPLMSMGAPGAPVTAWYWRADEPGPGRQVSATGLGSTVTVDRQQVQCAARYRDGAWQVVIARSLDARGDTSLATLAPGKSTRFSLAVWEGSHGERAGIKAVALGPLAGWHALDLDPAP